MRRIILGSEAYKYGRTSPRYRPSKQEGVVVRFYSSQANRIVTTRIYDISETGIAFTTSFKLAPRVGEVIKLDFRTLGSVQIACLGKVVRTEDPSPNSSWARFPDTIKVGIQFYRMPKTYSKLLSDSLTHVFKTQNVTIRHQAPRRKINFNFADMWLVKNFYSIVMTVLIVGMTGALIYYLAQKSQEKETQVDSPWAKGFFDKVVPPPPPK